MHRVTRLFITGTDTEVGKTYVTCAIACALVAQGHRPRAIKPLATGEPSPGSDAVRIAEAAEHPPKVHTCLPSAAAPARAAAVAGVDIDFDDVVEWIRIQSNDADPLLVEGVGGWMVPITARHHVADLAAALAFPVLVVAANRLGVLNHTVLTVDAICAAGLSIAAVVLNDWPGTDPQLAGWNHADLRTALAGQIPVVRIEHNPSSADQVEVGQAILRALR